MHEGNIAEFTFPLALSTVLNYLTCVALSYGIDILASFNPFAKAVISNAPVPGDDSMMTTAFP